MSINLANTIRAGEARVFDWPKLFARGEPAENCPQKVLEMEDLR
jgi:hypothetical protein